MMRVGINGMGRIGRLAVRAAPGGVLRPDDDPRAANRLNVVHVNELKGGAATTTGSATAIGLIYPELQGRLNGYAVRAPVLNASLTDCVFELKRPTTEAEVNGLFRSAASSILAGILGCEERPLVSADYANDTRSAVVDALSTMVTDGTMLKVYAWYDNEMGYACRMVDLACLVGARGL